MSDLQKKWAKAKINSAMHAAMAPPPMSMPLPVSLPEFNELDEDRYGPGSVPNTPQDDDSSSASSVSSTGTVIPSPGRALFARPQGFPGRSLDPIPWTTYFERELFLPAEDGSITHHAYLTSPAPAAGPGKPPGPLFVTHHGAGSCGLSFAVLSAEIKKRLPTAGILSLDARGHGLTATRSSLPTLAADLLAVITRTKEAMRWPAMPPIILVGHSLGGAVVTELAFSLAQKPPPPPSSSAPFPPPTSSHPTPIPTAAVPSLPPKPEATAWTPTPTPAPAPTRPALDILGYAVLDVVEGSALDALQGMHAYLATRPAGFESVRDAVEWHVRSRTLRNAVSARASVPGLLVHASASASAPASASASASGPGPGPASAGDGDADTDADGDVDMMEEDVSEAAGGRGAAALRGSGSGSGGKTAGKPWRWRTDLAKTQPFWEGWFDGLSKKFLAGRGGKMLLLAGTDRLDTELTIGQMQGKYALQVFPEAGHFIHEDLPEKTAIALVDFHRRNDRSALVLPPKVSELLAQGKRV
ncbi:72693cd1-8994-475f-9dc3-c99a3f52cd2a [Thermothielavioides terrestris]|uniref:Protein phosphatase methylesterase 1 n=1 Tax=Thermothielavioides terrestris TaxID=2587410 RepID=A0A3S4C0G0_9PEZI|nr:72693cd1-8994-475f-9dc3-c99a3f52cd2a [Thermothielavioides terrestris]